MALGKAARPGPLHGHLQASAIRKGPRGEALEGSGRKGRGVRSEGQGDPPHGGGVHGHSVADPGGGAQEALPLHLVEHPDATRPRCSEEDRLAAGGGLLLQRRARQAHHGIALLHAQAQCQQGRAGLVATAAGPVHQPAARQAGQQAVDARAGEAERAPDLRHAAGAGLAMQVEQQVQGLVEAGGGGGHGASAGSVGDVPLYEKKFHLSVQISLLPARSLPLGDSFRGASHSASIRPPHGSSLPRGAAPIEPMMTGRAPPGRSRGRRG